MSDHPILTLTDVELRQLIVICLDRLGRAGVSGDSITAAAMEKLIAERMHRVDMVGQSSRTPDGGSAAGKRREGSVRST